MFNSLKYVKMLEEVGVPRKQAELQMQIMTDVIETNLATKQDIKDLILATKQDFKDLTSVTRQEIKDLTLSTKRDIEELASTTQRDIKELALTTKQDIASLDTKFSHGFELLRNDVRQSEYRMIIKLGSIMTIIASLAIAAVKLI